ncbi:MAG: SH3 domain-containing protein [Pseudomonadota bacterium]
MIRAALRACVLALAVLATPVVATGELRGSETNLPIPRYVSMKATEANIRRGPSLSHRIDWVFKHKDMPLKVTAEHGHWRRVQDRDGMGGWIHYSLISGSRTVIIEEDMLALYPRAEQAGQVVARLEFGVVAKLGKCRDDWCRLTAGGYRGWARKSALWGIEPAAITR